MMMNFLFILEENTTVDGDLITIRMMLGLMISVSQIIVFNIFEYDYKNVFLSKMLWSRRLH